MYKLAFTLENIIVCRNGNLMGTQHRSGSRTHQRFLVSDSLPDEDAAVVFLMFGSVVRDRYIAGMVFFLSTPHFLRCFLRSIGIRDVLVPPWPRSCHFSPLPDILASYYEIFSIEIDISCVESFFSA